MKVITITNQKGGCGKTISAVNIAGAFAGLGKKVIFIDLDPQHHATSSFGINIIDPLKSSYSIFDTFLKQSSSDLRMLMQYKYNNLWVIGSHISLSTIEQKMSGAKNAILVLLETLNYNADILADIDYIIIDTPPGLGFLTLNAIHAAERLIVPLEASLFSMKGVAQINEIINISEKMGYKKPEINFLITLFDGRSNFSKNFLQKARDCFGEQLFATIIRSNIKLREAALEGKVIFDYAPYSNGAKDYGSLIEEIEPKINVSKFIFSDTNKPETLFKLHAPEADNVYIVGSFNNWMVDKNYLMQKTTNGIWLKNIPLPKGTYYYKFIVDGKWKEDPNNNFKESDRFGGINSVLLVRN